LLAATFGALGAVASLGGTKTYTSTTVMLIDDPYSLATQGDSEFIKLDALRVKYSGLVDTNAIAQPVASRLHLPVGAVLGSASTDVPFESLLMDVSATWSSPREAQILSQAVADEVTNYVKTEDAVYGIPKADQFTFNTIDPASPPITHAPSKSKALVLAIGLAVVGFALGFLATQLVRYLR
jgi:capsular polysaccharide biosynthesis protein